LAAPADKLIGLKRHHQQQQLLMQWADFRALEAPPER
jgi:hypothetical protein